MFLDFSSAFNTLPLQGLLDTFADTNPPYWQVKWAHIYFTGRSQYIRAHRKVSSTIPNNYGILQGTVLSPFFFILHSADLFSEALVIGYRPLATPVGMPKAFLLLAMPSSTFQNGLGVCSIRSLAREWPL